MKKSFKGIISFILSAVMLAGLSVPAYASEVNTNLESVEVITDSSEIQQILQEKGIYEEGEEVLAVIELESQEPRRFPQSRLIWREIYTELVAESSGTKSSAKYSQNYPAGSFSFSQSFTSGWQLTANLGIKVEVFEAAMGYQLNESTTETWTYNSGNYSYPFNVKAYVNWERKTYTVYDEDLVYDDYIGRTSIERETGYTIKVTKQ